MKKSYTLLLMILVAGSTWGQIGINTSAPNTSLDLDVVGNAKTDNSVFLENPGNNTTLRGAKLLIRTTTNEIIKYDLNASKYGYINYAQFVFKELSTNGLQDYDTKIPVADYTLSVQGYYFVKASNGDTSVMTHSNAADINIEGYQIYAYPNIVTNTWFIRAFINNGTFRARNGGNFIDTTIDMILNVIIYRNRFITKQLAPITHNMSGSQFGTTPLPPGF